MKLHHLFVFFYIFLLFGQLQAQIDTSDTNYKKYFYENGQISSEGILIEGKPNGYWKTYYKEGTLKSEGNRENFKLDSTWKFYKPDGDLAMIINYEEGLKNGMRVTYSEEEIIIEQFKNGIKHGWNKVFFADSTLKSEVYYKKGKKNGYEKIYDQEGNIISLKKYENGFLVSREFINRKDNQGRKQGTWKTFYENGNIKTSVNYLDGKKHGISKQYDKQGKLISIEKYENGKKVVKDKSTANYEIRRNYYSNGQVKTKATYLNDTMDGVRREYDREGNISDGYIMEQGKVVGKGIVDKQGMKQNDWKEYYKSGKLKAIGQYLDDVKVGEWIYYFENGQIEQRGEYNKNGKAEGLWRWYYSNGQLRRQEYLKNGIPDGMYKEFTFDGKLWARGNYEDSLREGNWLITHRGYKEVGKYDYGVRKGEWRHYKGDVLVYEGKFVDGLPNGKHVAYWDNGNKKYEGVYNMGEKNGEWRRYTRIGELFLVISYKFGKEVKYDNKKIELPEEEMVE